MRPPPPLSQLSRYPITGGLGLLALGISAASLIGRTDVSALYEDYHILEGQYWRLLTSTLPHGSPFHLAFNLYWLWVFGSLIEGSFGHLKTLFLFVVLALGANGAEFAILDGGIGLSGVGYGLFGFLWVLSRRSPRFAGVVDDATSIMFAVWFVLCIVLTYTGVMPIANIAHGVGALLGGLIGTATVSLRRRHRTIAGASAAAIVVASVLGATAVRSYINLSPHRGQDEAYVGYQALIANNPVEARRMLERAVKMNPDDAGSWLNLGIACDRLNDKARAAECFATANQLDPKPKMHDKSR